MSTRLVTEGLGLAGDGDGAVCAHCGQPAARVDGLLARPWFCCSGCRAAHALLCGAGLAEYYDFRARQRERGAPAAAPADGAFSEFDAPAFKRLYCQTLSAEVDRAELELGGLHCAACVWLIERLPRLQPAVTRAEVDLGRGRVTLEFLARGAGSVTLSQVARDLARLGYAPRPVRGLEADRERRGELRGLLLRIGVAGASAGNVMLLAFALYGGADEVAGLPEAGTMARATLRFLHMATWLVSLPALWAAGTFFRGAWSSLRTRTPHMDLPIAIGILTAFGWGTVSIGRGVDGLYFDTITTLIFLLLIGRYLDARSRQRHSQAAELVHAVLPGRAHRALSLAGAEVESVPVECLQPGNLVLIRSGEVAPADGIVRRGESTLDLSLMSGESLPGPVGPGDEVLAGAINVGADLWVEVTTAGAETRVAQLLQAATRTALDRPPLLGLTNRLAGRFTLVVLGSAVCVFAIWAPQSPALALSHALAVLIVACPCALGMATPLALTSAVAQAARTGILFARSSTIERLASPSLIVLDKTGTLTLGRLRVTRRVGSRGWDPLVLALERNAHHPAGRALCAHLEGLGTPVNQDVRGAREVLGGGLAAETSMGELLVGSAPFVLARAHQAAEVDAALEEATPAESPVLIAVGGTVVGAFFLEDEIRPDAAASLRRLADLGHRLCILSGDRTETVAYVADELGRAAQVRFESVQGQVSPEQKLEQVKAWAADRPSVVMVGDGINDAGALAAAHVGVAVGGAAEAARLSADVYLSRPGAAELTRLFVGARRTLRTIRRGVGFSLGYNALGFACAAAGVLSPLVAAVLMPLSSLTVVTHAFRCRTFHLSGGERRAP